MAGRASLRASDADREKVADRLRGATAEGRLLVEELEERLGLVFAARTYRELDALVADLPGPRAVSRPRGRELELGRRVLTLVFALAVGLAILAAAAFVLAGLVATWAIWIVVGWCFFGRRFHAYGPRHGWPHPVRGGDPRASRHWYA